MLSLPPPPPPVLARVAAAPCGPEVRARLLTAGPEPVRLTCGLILDPEDRVLRRIVVEGAAGGVAIDCRGATLAPGPGPFDAFALEIRSVRAGAGYARPADVAVSGCTILGHVRVWGMAINGQGAALRESSHAAGHTARAQAAAPTRVAFRATTFVAQGAIPLYLAPGVTEVLVEDCRFAGRSGSVALYLDAESARNRILRNRFETEVGREVLAVDGSAENVIAGNRFRLGNWGSAVDLYRNCGEGGTVRHQTPSGNTITGNRFTYAGFLRPTAVRVGAREGWRLYCGEDAGYPFGSSLDDGDHASDNRVEDNAAE